LKFSRHAKNNMRLYGITDDEVELTISAPEQREAEGDYVVAYRHFLRRFGGFPLKVVYVMEDDEPLIVTAYPLRKTFRR